MEYNIFPLSDIFGRPNFPWICHDCGKRCFLNALFMACSLALPAAFLKRSCGFQAKDGGHWTNKKERCFLFNIKFPTPENFSKMQQKQELGGGNSNIFLFSPLFGEDSHFDEYFSNELKPPTREASLVLRILFPIWGISVDSAKGHPRLRWVATICDCLSGLLGLGFSWVPKEMVGDDGVKKHLFND